MGSESNQNTQDSKVEGPDLNSYIRLRTMLDSLEFGAIKYFLDEEQGRGGRFDELNGKLLPIIDWLWKKPESIDCPEGYIDCHGVCVPYPCPD